MDLSFLMVFLKKYFMDPMKRQIFRDTSGQIFSLILRPCRKWLVLRNRLDQASKIVGQGQFVGMFFSFSFQ